MNDLVGYKKKPDTNYVKIRFLNIAFHRSFIDINKYFGIILEPLMILETLMIGMQYATN